MEPNNQLLLLLAEALMEAKHKNVAEHLVAGFLWSCYPEWFDAKVSPESASTNVQRTMMSVIAVDLEPLYEVLVDRLGRRRKAKDEGKPKTNMSDHAV